MKLSRKVVATVSALALTLGVATATQAEAVDTQTAKTISPDENLWGKLRPITKDDARNVVRKTEPEAWYSLIDGNKVKAFNVFSPSMGREIPVAVIPAKDANGKPVQGAPIIYLLNGAGGAEQGNDWLTYAKTQQYFEKQGVNVVIPMEGAFSYYADWATTPKVNGPDQYYRGPQKWETFLAKELPGPIERELGADSRRAIVGFSMSGTPALVIPSHYPGFYTAAASFSGCAATSSPAANFFARLTVNRGSGTPEEMWGPAGGEYNRYNDALVNAEKLRDTKLYISGASGLAAETDMPGYLKSKIDKNDQNRATKELAASAGAATLIVEGGVIEAAINSCNHDFKAKMDRINGSQNVNYKLRNAGTHSWPQWREDYKLSWEETIAPAFGMKANPSVHVDRGA
ncbi:alpha/beta hydrolase [Corynebacterium aquatimens]|uniref:S-formylglutathione hydrolase FrmB n=1 Tax=Corynebacterium aquatimens TaxID=1190508 RepID=A0A931GXU5_9CORY|nr:alpha/beta hydrolase family protein [Corynebacterium aquatimens]MBG6122489.1 S-formylglutathione hydrolase FrmB [Corynebacterium aquatimens]WJY64971.1 Diacylglycerol acyltransferase/mycolyltransferase Ag85C precursor [Corynebacterium aquatimens]